MPRLELAVFTLPSALAALHSGAHRLELCADYSSGGVTPSVSTLLALKAAQSQTSTPIPIHVMIRPRPGSFIYMPAEVEQMLSSMREFIAAGADGFVFGALIPSPSSPASLEIDAPTLLPLLDLARSSSRPLQCIFHRAFDALPPSTFLSSLGTLITLGFDGVLTSGGVGDVEEGKIGVIRDLVERAEREGRFEVVLGGGVRGANWEVWGGVGMEWVHSSALGAGNGEEGGERCVDLEEVGRLLDCIGR